MVEHQERRLRSAFRHILLTVVAAPLALEACSASSKEGHVDAGKPDAALRDGAGADGGAFDPCSPTFVDASGPDADPCALLAHAPCGAPAGVKPMGDSICTIPVASCGYFCQDFYFSCHAIPASCMDGSLPDGPITVDCVTCLGAVGRRPAGLEPVHGGAATSALGDYFARVAHLEAASIRAFHDLRSELAERGAPGALVHHASRAARDEVRHARAMGRLARRFGGSPPRPRVRRRQRRSLEAMARENAVEGCVREAYGALLATWQAAHARDPDVAAEMALIAADETRHAALSWAIARWAEPLLGPRAQERLAALRQSAIQRLQQEIAALPNAVSRVAGFPSRAVQRSLIAAFERLVTTGC